MKIAEWAVVLVLAIVGFILVYYLVISGWLPSVFKHSEGLLVEPKVHSIATYLNI